MNAPPSLERLIEALARLPGIGKKTAQRLAFHLLTQPPKRLTELAESLTHVRERLQFCTRCGNYTEDDPCNLCRDAKRLQNQICVVEQPSDIYVIERSGAYRGLYHVLMGLISPLDGIGPRQLRIAELLERVAQHEVQEVILATNASIPGEATALHLQNVLRAKVPHISRPARGLPAGAHLEFTDDVTLTQAFAARQHYPSG